MKRDATADQAAEKGVVGGPSQQHLRWLVCPACRGAITLARDARGAEDKNHAAHHIHCTGCGRDFPIVDGLPVLLVNRAAGGI